MSEPRAEPITREEMEQVQRAVRDLDWDTWEELAMSEKARLGIYAIAHMMKWMALRSMGVAYGDEGL